ncbi:23S rRNA (uracil(1939)-C(5))-methyltransferase RlmD [Mycoplasmatota bacterium zrk1]
MLDKNKYYKVEIIDYTYDGLGVGKVDNFPIFVSNAVMGEILIVEITNLKKNLAFGKIVEIINGVKERVESKCKYYGECGGCHLMHMSYQEQLRFKTNHVKETLKRIGGVDTKINSCVGMEHPYNYRNKLIIPFADNKAGLYKKGTHDIIDIEECHILNREGLDIIKFIKKLPVSKLIRNVLIRNSYYKDQFMLVIISRMEIKLDDLSEILKEFPNIVSIINNINNENTNVILGKKSKVLYGEDFYVDYLLENVYKINHKSFYQINSEQTEKLYKKAIESVSLKNKVVVDAYSGIGSIGLSFAKNAKRVYGIEVVEAAVESARENAKNNEVDNIEFYLGKAEEVISNVISNEVDVVITDPPRKGCGEAFLQSLIDNNIDDIVYISCNVSTLARDIKFLNDYYDVIEVTPFDMFPQTFHVECCAVLKRKCDN